jgi:hypothetical protein
MAESINLIIGECVAVASASSYLGVTRFALPGRTIQRSTDADAL